MWYGGLFVALDAETGAKPKEEEKEGEAANAEQSGDGEKAEGEEAAAEEVPKVEDVSSQFSIDMPRDRT